LDFHCKDVRLRIREKQFFHLAESKVAIIRKKNVAEESKYSMKKLKVKIAEFRAENELSRRRRRFSANELGT